MRRVIVLLSVLLIVLFLGLFIGCGDENTSPLSSDSNSQPLVLILAGSNNEHVKVSSPNGQFYTEQSLQKAIKIAAQSGQTLETRFIAQSFLGKQKLM